MGLLQQRSPCTVHDGHGGTCGELQQCTHVRTLSLAWSGLTIHVLGLTGAVLFDPVATVVHEHDVCSHHRVSMGLPPHDVDLTAAGEYRPEVIARRCTMR